MTRVRRSDEIAIDDDRRILHPGCTGGFSVGLHDQFGVRRAVIEPRHAAAGNDPRTGGQHRPSADASDDSASSADVSYELGYAWIFGKQGRAFCTTWNEDAHIVLGPRFRYRTPDIQQAGPREIAVNLDRLLARGHHLHLVASLIEGDLGKEVLLLLKRVSDEGGNLWALIGHRKSPFALFVSLAAPLMDSVKREPRDQVERGASNAAFRVALRWRPFNSANADRTNNAAFAKNEERSLL